uniref:Inhibitor of growth protein N-terminal histone-binding domain-containing protein n=1 Tax=Cyprinus carpio TaxID=7962 RepID=A0A8C2FCH3_CYPCA
MLGHYPNVEKAQLVNYVEDYLECVESLPLDIQRNVSLLREIDTKYQAAGVALEQPWHALRTANNRL